jgi:hypothetical protein
MRKDPVRLFCWVLVLARVFPTPQSRKVNSTAATETPVPAATLTSRRFPRSLDGDRLPPTETPPSARRRGSSRL